MKAKRPLVILAVVAALLALPAYTAFGESRDPSPPEEFRVLGQTALDEAFTYQGRLTENQAPANGNYDFQFTIYGAETGSAQVCNTAADDVIQQDNVQVTNGMFVTSLDFCPEAFDGDARWLEIALRPGSSTGTYTVLSPRQEITPTPYALFAKRVGGLQIPFSASGATTGTTAVFSVTQTGTTTPGLALIADGATGTGAKISGDVAALDLDGPLKVSGTKTAFTLVAEADGASENVCDPDEIGDAANGVEVPTAVANAATDLLIVTLNGLSDLGGPFAVYFEASDDTNCANSQWVIYSLSDENLDGAIFNVLVIKQ